MQSLQDLNSKRVLVLNADFRPLSYAPLSTIGWEDAVKDVVAGKYNVVAEYDDLFIRSPSTHMNLPSIVSKKEYVKPHAYPAYTRQNIFIAFRYRCAYCGQRFKPNELTFDHVQPKSQGGKSDWTNIAAACVPCNMKKADKSLKQASMQLLQKPCVPTWNDFYEAGRSLPAEQLSPEWNEFLYWNVELDES